MHISNIKEKLLLNIFRFFSKNHNTKTPLISVIIATYNRGEILCNRTIPSILSQTYPYFEIVIVGDCVIDNTAELINKIDEERIKFINLEKRTQYPTDTIDRWMVAGATPRNIGLKVASGDWIYTISDDDILLPYCFERMINYVNENTNVESVSANYISYVDGEERIFRASDVEKNLGFFMTGIPSWMYKSNLKFFKWNLNSWRKKWNRPSDYDLQNRMKNAGVKMGYFDEVISISPPMSGTKLTGSKAVLYLNEIGNYN